jgi:hypothetical protein
VSTTSPEVSSFPMVISSTRKEWIPLSPSDHSIQAEKMPG